MFTMTCTAGNEKELREGLHPTFLSEVRVAVQHAEADSMRL
jgi:hypothetical protein